MDPLTITALVDAGVATARKIMEAVQAMREDRATPEQIELLKSLRAENQAKSDALGEKLEKIESGGQNGGADNGVNNGATFTD